MDADDQNALLLFRVGPACCCAPSRPVAGVVPLPPLHRPPGSDALHPGVFRHGGHLVRVVDLGYGFGTPRPDSDTGRIIVTELPTGRFGFRVDDIIDVLEWPAEGWGNLPPPIPRTWFRRTLQHDGRLCLYTEFDRLAGMQGGGILREYLHALAPETKTPAPPDPVAEPSSGMDSGPAPAPAVTATEPADADSQATAPQPGPSSRQDPLVPPPVRKPPATAAKSARRPPPPSRPTAPPSATPVRSRQAESSRPPARRNPPPGSAPAAPARPSPAPAQTHAPSPPGSGSLLSALLLMGLLMAGLGSGIWYALTYWLAPQPDRVSPAVPALPAAPPAAVSTPDGESHIQAGTVPVPPSRPVAETPPEPPDLVAVTTGPQPTPPAPAYRAEIRDDDEGITIVLHQPPPDPAPQSAAGQTVIPDTGPPVPATQSPPVRARKKAVPVIQREIVHVVVRGDTLWDIAARYVHDPFRYPELARLSHIRNPDRIYPGDRVRILVVQDHK